MTGGVGEDSLNPHRQEDAFAIEPREFEDALQGLRILRSFRGQLLRPGQHAGTLYNGQGQGRRQSSLLQGPLQSRPRDRDLLRNEGTRDCSVVWQFGDQMSVFHTDGEAHQFGIGAIDADALGVLKAPAVGRAHEHPSPVYNFFSLMGADVGE